MSNKVPTSKSPVISVLNLKGGVGKTTITACVSRALFERKRKKTLLLDLDPQFNLTQSLFTRSSYEKIKQSGKTIFSAMEPMPTGGLLNITASTLPPPPVETLTQRLRYFKADQAIAVSIVPGDFALSKYSLTSDQGKLKAVQGRFEAFVADARAKHDITMIDCNPSSSFLTLCALNVSDYLLVPVRPDKYSLLGLELLADFIDSIPSLHPKPKLLVLLNGIPRSNYDKSVEMELRGHALFGKKTLARFLHQSAILTAKTDYTGFVMDRKVPHRIRLNNEIGALVDELSPLVGIN